MAQGPADRLADEEVGVRRPREAGGEQPVDVGVAAPAVHVEQGRAGEPHVIAGQPREPGRRAHGQPGRPAAPPPSARRTITHDNGGEFAQHEAVKEAIGLRAYFCDPHSPWQRGSIENANGRLRRDLPRKTSLEEYTDADIDDVIWNLNATPRKCLGYRTPIEVFAANLGVALEM